MHGFVRSQTAAVGSSGATSPEGNAIRRKRSWDNRNIGKSGLVSAPALWATAKDPPVDDGAERAPSPVSYRVWDGMVAHVEAFRVVLGDQWVKDTLEKFRVQTSQTEMLRGSVDEQGSSSECQPKV